MKRFLSVAIAVVALASIGTVATAAPIDILRTPAPNFGYIDIRTDRTDELRTLAPGYPIPETPAITRDRTDELRAPAPTYRVNADTRIDRANELRTLAPGYPAPGI